MIELVIDVHLYGIDIMIVDNVDMLHIFVDDMLKIYHHHYQVKYVHKNEIEGKEIVEDLSR
jgi:hypothetical protein